MTGMSSWLVWKASRPGWCGTGKVVWKDGGKWEDLEWSRGLEPGVLQYKDTETTKPGPLLTQLGGLTICR